MKIPSKKSLEKDSFATLDHPVSKSALKVNHNSITNLAGSKTSASSASNQRGLKERSNSQQNFQSNPNHMLSHKLLKSDSRMLNIKTQLSLVDHDSVMLKNRIHQLQTEENRIQLKID